MDVIRTCIGCRGKFPQKTLIRFACHSKGTLQVDLEKRLTGRGAYVCWAEACIQKAFKAPNRINSLLRVQLSRAVIAQFEQTLLESTEKSSRGVALPEGKRRNRNEKICAAKAEACPSQS